MKRLISLFFLLVVAFAQILPAESQTTDTPSPIASVSGLTVSVAPFQTGPFSFSGGNLDVVANGTWFVGVDLYRNTLIALPRLGHRGWVPVAKVVAGEHVIATIEQISPALPASRIPRALQKIRDEQPLNVVVMGSSLAEGSATNRWSGMLFNSASNLTDYKVPGISIFKNVALGGAPNQYTLSQLGYGWPDGRSSLFDNIDLVVLTCLANGGDYRLSIIEPIIRNLRQRGIEIILLTDNPQNPTLDYASMQNSLLYRDGGEVTRIAELYGVELADTAAHVFEQHLRYGSGIYSDAIHMTSVVPNGTTVAQPSGGHEVYARAVRSIIPLTSGAVGKIVKNSDFNDGPQGFTAYRAASITAVDGKLRVTKTTGVTDQWGGWVDVPTMKTGDRLRVQGKWAFEDGFSGRNIQIGIQGGGPGWGSAVASSAQGNFNVYLTVSRDITSGNRLLFFANNDEAPINAAFSIDDIVVTVYPSNSPIDLISDFNDGPQGFTAYRAASITAVDGKLKVSKTTGVTDQWGSWIDVPTMKTGDRLRVKGKWAFEDGFSGRNIQIGMQGGGPGWGSTVASPAQGNFDVYLTANRDIASGSRLLFFANNDAAPINTAFSIDDIAVTVTPGNLIIDLIPGRAVEAPQLPPRLVSVDPKSPTDAVVTLPKDEIYSKSTHPARGILGSHPSGANSFARRFSLGVTATQDLLTLTSGQKAMINETSGVGISMIRYARTTDSPVTVEIRRNNQLLKTLTLGAGYNREEYVAIFTPIQYAQLPPAVSNGIELTVSSGSLQICALVTLTTDQSIPITYWAAEQGLFGADALPSATPFQDGVSNLLKYAFNIPLDGPRVSQLNPAVGIGSSGLPVFTVNSNGSSSTFRAQFLRRRDGDINYVPQYSTNMVDFTPMLAPPVITTIDSEWEMLTVDQVFEAPAPSAVFGRLQVGL